MYPSLACRLTRRTNWLIPVKALLWLLDHLVSQKHESSDRVPALAAPFDYRAVARAFSCREILPRAAQPSTRIRDYPHGSNAHYRHSHVEGGISAAVPYSSQDAPILSHAIIEMIRPPPTMKLPPRRILLSGICLKRTKEMIWDTTKKTAI